MLKEGRGGGGGRGGRGGSAKPVTVPAICYPKPLNDPAMTRQKNQIVNHF